MSCSLLVTIYLVIFSNVQIFSNFTSSCVCRVPVREEPTVGQKRTRREQQQQQRDSRETTPVTPDRPPSSDSVTASLANNLPTNNNIKNATASTTRQDNNGTRNRNVRIDIPVKPQLNTAENADLRGARASSLPVENKTYSGGKDSKTKNSADSRVKSTSDAMGNATRKIPDPKRNEQRASEDSRRTEDRNKSSPEGINDEIISVVIPNKCESTPKRDSKEVKGKQKRKPKAINKREEKDKRIKTKESSATKGKDDEGGLSDDSGSDGSSDKSVPDVRIQQPSKETNRTRNGSLPTDAQLVHFKDQQQQQSSAKPAAFESVDTCKDRAKSRKNHTTMDSANGKSKKGEAQSVNGNARPKTLEVPGKGQNNGHTNKSQSGANSPDSGVKSSELRHLGPTSPHAIAAAVMSLALGKNMQASSKENNFDEQELNKKKAYNKTSALSTGLSDSPPPTSPTSLSGSSRSSSYSSIVSSDSSNGVEQVKPVKGSKSRVKGTKSVPLEGGAGPSWPSAGKAPPNSYISGSVIKEALPKYYSLFTDLLFSVF